MSTTKRNKPGPKPDRVKIEGDWMDAIKRAFKKKRPKGGWPDDSGVQAHPEPENEQKQDE